MAASTQLQEFKKKIEDASLRISSHVRKTPLNYSSWLAERCGGKVFLKMESEQLTNSFKLRGASNFVVSKLEDSEWGENNKSRKFITASSGNHGLACSNIMSSLGTPEDLTVYVANTASETKIKAIKRHGTHVVIQGSDCVEAEIEARKTAKENGATYISPYNDIRVIMGQGTIGKEIFDDLPSVDAVFVPVGGGGLISGIALYLKSVKPDVKVIGCQPKNSCVMHQSIKAGEILDIESLDTLSDGTAGGIESGSITFEFCQRYVDDWIMVSEEEIQHAVYKTMEEDFKLVEGAAGVAVAAFLKTIDKWKGKKSSHYNLWWKHWCTESQ